MIRLNRSKQALGLLFMSLLSLVTGVGCSQQATLNPPEEPKISFLAPELVGEPQPVISEEELFYLTEEQERDFYRYFNGVGSSRMEPYRRVFKFLQRYTENFQYEDKTYTASEALRLKRGNCMSLAVLTTAIARLGNVRINYELIDSTPVFDRKADIVVKGLHVRSKLYPERGEKIWSLHSSGFLVDYFPGGDTRFLGDLNRNEFLAMYYRNRAAEFIAENQYDKAYWYTLKSFQYDPNNENGLNYMAVLFRRMGDEHKAEEIFRFGIDNAEENVSLLKNYRSLLETQNRWQEAQALQQRIDTMKDLSPFAWINLAEDAFERGEYQNAERFYNKAVQVAPYLKFSYIGLSKTYYQLGRFDEAQSTLMQAMEKDYNPSNMSIYKAKLEMLSRLRNPSGAI